MIKKFNNFLNKDIRWKIKILSKKFKINFYPKLFSFKGLKGYYEKIILNLILIDKFYKKKKLVKKNIFINIYNKNNNKINCLVSSPGSASNYIRCLFSSYFEIFYKIGNGIPKFSNIHNKFIFAASPILSADLWNAVNIDTNQIFDNDNFNRFISIEDFHKKKIFFSRYPFDDQEFFKWQNSRTVVLTRDPFDWMISYYSHHEGLEYKNSALIDKKIIDESLTKLSRYFYFWINYISDNKNFDFEIVEYKQVINNPKKEFLRICNFYQYDISNESLIDRCIEFNSKEFALKNLNVNFHGTRFTSDERKKLVRDKLENYLADKIKSFDLIKSYQTLVSIKNKIFKSKDQSI